MNHLHKLEHSNGFKTLENRNKTQVLESEEDEDPFDDVTHLTRHNISEISRAKMVDWMFEVLNAFEMSLQTFYLSV